MTRYSRSNHQLAPIREYRAGLYDNEPQILAQTAVEARRQLNVPDWQFFNNLKLFTSDWARSSFNFSSLRVEIGHYLATAELTRQDHHWIKGPAGRRHFTVDMERFRRFDKAFEPFTREYLRTLYWVNATYMPIHPNTRSILEKSNYLHSDYRGTTALLHSLNTYEREQFLDYRLELNPELEVQLPIFRQLMDHFEASRLAVAGSTLNRFEEIMLNYRIVAKNPGAIFGTLPLKTKRPRLRTDSIILLTSQEYIDRVLESVWAVYDQCRTDFNQRSSTKLMSQLAPGIALSDNHNYVNNQRHNHVKLLSTTINNCQKYAIPPEGLSFEVFQQQLLQLAQAWNIDTHNLAFAFQS